MNMFLGLFLSLVSNSSGGLGTNTINTGIVNNGNGAHNGAEKAFWITCTGTSPLAE